MAIPETMAERVKAALKAAGTSVSGLAVTWGVDRSGLSDRINGEKLSEPELAAIAEIAGTTPAYLRYGILGGFTDGFVAALAQVEAVVRGIRPPAHAERPAATQVTGRPVPIAPDEFADVSRRARSAKKAGGRRG